MKNEKDLDDFFNFARNVLGKPVSESMEKMMRQLILKQDGRRVLSFPRNVKTFSKSQMGEMVEAFVKYRDKKTDT